MHKKIIVFGNSGSGKSTLAKTLQKQHQLAHLDLDTLAWQTTEPPSRKPLSESQAAINQFMADNEAWVIEGCYGDLLAWVSPQASHAVFMNLPVDLCQQNARSRPWEPHKYPSKAKQDANLPMLLDWIAQYTKRDDDFSFSQHQALFQQFTGSKLMMVENWQDFSDF
ncbi:AAA family ATPase [Marinicella litoralis]|uniref:Adenylate kinase family enzyme n=1 Tax=Marinicella litoralis TaxID=644220 RepID=A0A4V3DIZ3_9GAMM|nr:AAA family ATPase [Marinicella litoralis]TDR23741.1 adenylate kinase family enzyme [Marinicella litoralis]